MEQQSSKRDYFLPVSILVAGVLIAGSLIYSTMQKNPGNLGANVSGEPETPAVDERDVILGDPKAPVSIIEYADYQCPYCGLFQRQSENPLRDEYIKAGKVKMVYRNFPFLDQFQGGKNESHLAAEAAECAKDQNKFWAFHDAIYDAEYKDEIAAAQRKESSENNGNLNRDLFLGLAKNLEMDVNAFTQCFDSGKYKQKVAGEPAEAQKYGVDSTPTIFINGVKYAGALPFATSSDSRVPTLKSIIDPLLK
jgi:protein-disulfide isomerase